MLTKHKWLSITLLLAALLLITLIVLSLIPGKRAGSSVLSELLSTGETTVTVSELSFDTGRSRAFAHFNGSVACAGTLGLQVLGPDGRETLRESFRMSTPALAEAGGRFLCYDISGTAVRVFDSYEILISIETDGPVISASINSNGWFCIVTGEQTGGVRGIVNVYNDKCRRVYSVTMYSGYVTSARLADNNRTLAILNITEHGSRVNIYDGLDDEYKDNADFIYELGSEINADIEYITETDILIYGTQSVRLIKLSENAPARLLYSYDGKRLGSYANTAQFCALHLYDYNIGYSGQVVTFDFNGTLLGQIDTEPDITSMAAYGGTLMLLSSEGISFYGRLLDTRAGSDGAVSVATAGTVVALGEDIALAANDLSAIVVRRAVGGGAAA